MEKTGNISPGITPDVKEPEKRACACNCKCRQKKLPFKEAVVKLEDDAVARLANTIASN